MIQILSIGMIQKSNSQDISLLALGSNLRQTYVNPAASLNKKWNVSLMNTQVELLTDGPAINQLTSVNSNGRRYIHPDNWQNHVNPENLISGNFQLNTIDIGFKTDKWTFLAGHAFRSFGSLNYTEDLLKLAANGNGPYINQTLQIGPIADYTTFNEIYVGVQKKFNKFTVGIKTKLLFGVSNLRTEEADIQYKTNDDFYQWELNTNYVIRSSSTLNFRNITDFNFNSSGITFDHLFYNNVGIAFDLGVNMQLSKNFQIFWSALDLGFIKWDFLPRHTVSKGKFTFEGIDPLTYLNDTTGINFSDSIAAFIPFTTITESYTTTLNNRFYLGAHYVWKEKWSFNACVRFHRSFVKSNAQLSLAATRSWKWLDVGISYAVTNGNLWNIGALLQVKWKPVQVFVATDNLFSLISLYDQKLANARGGLSISF
ncbi:MAG: hypothetical protein IPN79_07385 [Saprospiraceae bacterium]|nr:hypothetical protein [Saprospiraceae bacterium]